MPKTTAEIVRSHAPELCEWACAALSATAVPSSDAKIVAEALVTTSLWGIDSHGISRLPHYLNRLSHGSIVALSTRTFTRTSPAIGNLDGGHGLGIVVAREAMGHCIELAKSTGIGAVGVGNSSHCGAIGLYTRQACSAGMIGIAFTHSDSFVVPHRGKKAFFGTNPISIGIPSSDPERPLCVDMATSVVPWNRIMNARREGQVVPEGWCVDANGSETTDPNLARAVKPMSEHKGYALAFLIDMLCGPLNGMAYGPHLTPMYSAIDQHRRLGSFFIAIDPQHFPGGAVLPLVVSSAIADVKMQGSEILSPGDPEYRCMESRVKDGIPIEAGLVAEILDWSKRLGVQAPSFFPND